MPEITQAEQRLVDWQYAGKSESFFLNLFRAISKADTFNLVRLSMGFPDEVEAYRRFANESGYWQDVQRRAGINGN